MFRSGAHLILTASIALTSALSATLPAAAKDGLLGTGDAARQKALAGAGVADSRDAAAAFLNPAGLVRIDDQLTASASFFRSGVGFESSGIGGYTVPGSHEADDRWTTPYHLAASWRTGGRLVDAVGLTIAGGDGGRSRYGNIANPLCPPGLSGVSCGGALGIDVEHTTISLALAKKLAPGFSIGIAPFAARQTLSVTGVGLFAGLSVDPASFSDRDRSEAWGGGVRAGVEWEVRPGIRFGVAGATRTYMNRHKTYRGLLAEGADLDLPAHLQAGVAIDLVRNFTVMVDYKHIWYGAIAALANPSTSINPFGTARGPGFGWKDVDLFKFAAEWRPSFDTAVRIGYAYGTSLYEGRDADFNILMPHFVQHHLSAGVKRRVTERLDVELAAMYGLPMTRTGNEFGNALRSVRLETEQVEITAGVVYRFGQSSKPPVVEESMAQPLK